MTGKYRRKRPFLLPLTIAFFLFSGLLSHTARVTTAWEWADTVHAGDEIRMAVISPKDPSSATIKGMTAYRSDAAIERAIWHRLASYRNFEGSYLFIHVKDGLVTLSGAVGSVAERRSAIEAAWAAGVRFVKASQLVIAPWISSTDIAVPPHTRKNEPW